MNTKQLAIIGGAVATGARFYSGLGWKSALILGAVAAVAAGLSDNLTN